jgi:hypothetical protein
MDEIKKMSIETLRMLLWAAMILVPLSAMGVLDSYTSLPKDQEIFNFLVGYFIFLNLLGIFSIKKMEKNYPIVKKNIIKRDNKKIIKIIFSTILFIMIFLAIASLLILLLINEPQTINFEINILKLIICITLYWVFCQKLKKFLIR